MYKERIYRKHIFNIFFKQHVVPVDNDIFANDSFLDICNISSIALNAFHLSRQGVNGLHIFHIIKPSKWPAFMSIVLFTLAVGFVVWVTPQNSITVGNFNLYCSFVAFLSVFYFWCFDLMNESGEHNKRIRQGIKMGMILFIISEFMFFFAFFWAYLHSSTNPSIFIGHIWPPFGQASLLIESITLPFLNTLLLLTSGLCVTLAHKFSSVFFLISEGIINLKLGSFVRNFSDKSNVHIIRFGKLLSVLFSFNFMRHVLRIGLTVALLLTIILAVVFTNIQYNEYLEAGFNITDGIYASCFYLMTGFHGIHVIIGTIFLAVCFIQIKNVQSFYKEVTGLECAIWYWHFVDVVWLFLYVIVYLIADDAYQRPADFNLLERLVRHDQVYNTFSNGCLNEIKATGFATKNQIYFNFPATTAMSEIIWLHDYIMFFIIIIFFVVLALFYGILRDYTTVFLYEKYLKYAQHRSEMSGDIYGSPKGKGFERPKSKPIDFEEPLRRSKTY